MQNKILHFSIQGYVWTMQSLLQTLIAAAGGNLNQGYFSLLELEITDCLYHLLTFIEFNKSQHRKDTSDKLKDWNCEDMQFE